MILAAILATTANAADREQMSAPHIILTLDGFARATINVIREDGIAEYLPTIALPDSQEFRVIEGIPADVDYREAVQNVVRRSGYEKKEFFFGVRSAPGEITLGHYRPQQPTSFLRITKSRDGYSTSATATCAWWKLP